MVGDALVTAIAQTLTDWDEQRERLWLTVYRLVAHTMQEGAAVAADAAGSAESVDVVSDGNDAGR